MRSIETRGGASIAVKTATLCVFVGSVGAVGAEAAMGGAALAATSFITLFWVTGYFFLPSTRELVERGF